MSQFWGNFKGKEGSRLCTLCKSHPDIQDLFPFCYEIAKIFRNCDEIVQNVYSENVSDDCAMKLVQMLELND